MAQLKDLLVTGPSRFIGAINGPTSTTTNVGLLPQLSGNTANYLRGDGTWVTPPNTTYSAATTSANGLMTKDMVVKLNSIATGANAYTLPTASSSVLGGVKIGSNISLSSGTISLNSTNITNALGSSVTKNYVLASPSDQTGALSLRALTVDDIPGHARAVNGVYYGVCSTATATLAKTVTLTNGINFSLTTGVMVVIKFTNASTSASASAPMTLNINGTGAKPLYYYGNNVMSNGTSTNGWTNGAIVPLIYDGERWYKAYWYNTTYSNATLGQGYGTCSTAASTTEKAVSLTNYNLVNGGIVTVKFSNAVPANATLNINSKGAKSIYYQGVAITGNIIKAGDIAYFIYSTGTPTGYHLLGIDRTAVETYSTTSVTVNFSATSTVAVTVSGITVNSNIIVTPHPDSWSSWRDNGIRCSAQTTNSLTFIADSSITANTTANIVILP